MLSLFSVTDVSVSHNDERWHPTELTETGSPAQRLQETGSNRGWAAWVTYGYSWGDLGSRQKMWGDDMRKWTKNEREKWDWNSRQYDGEKCVQENKRGERERERGAGRESITSFVLKGQSQASDFKLKWSVGLAPCPPQYSMERERECVCVCLCLYSTSPPVYTFIPILHRFINRKFLLRVHLMYMYADTRV